MKLTKREEEIVDGSSIWTTDEEDADGQEELSWGVILFLEELGGRCHETMFGASIRRRREDLPAVTVTRLKSGDHVKYWCGGYAAVGSRVYRIGGDVQRYPDDCYPKEVYYCNIIEEDGGVLRCGNWEDGPSLSGGKPNPLLVTVNQKIYALAGPLISPYAHPGTGSYLGTEKLSPLFEVLDGENNIWETLPDPPFKSLYEGDYRGAQILSHTVVGNTIYMFVQSAINPFDSDPKFYSFDIEGKEWKEWGVAPGSPSSTIITTSSSSSSSPSSPSSSSSSPPPSSSSSSLTYNLLAYNLGLSDWASSADVVDNKMYVCVLDSWESGTKVFAYDLAAVKDIVPEQEEEDDEPCHDHVVVLPIHGLNHVTDKIPTHFSSGFVTHLVRNSFCLVATYNLHKKNWLRVCAFDVVEDDYKTICPRVRRPLCARNVSHIDYEIEDYVYVHNSYPWCKVGVHKKLQDAKP